MEYVILMLHYKAIYFQEMNRLKKKLEEIWEKEIQSAKDSIDFLKSSWGNPENLILYEKLSRLGNRIQLKQKEVMNRCPNLEGVISA